MTWGPIALVAVIALAVGAEAGQAPVSLPAPIRSSLDAHYTGWRIAAMNEETADSWRQAFPDAPPNVLQADYDGDGRGDYAVLVEYRALTDDGRLVPHRRAVAYLRRGPSYRLYPATDPFEVIPDEGWHLWPAAKGAKVYDLTVDQWVVLGRDGLDVNPEGRGPCSTFVFRGDQFDSIWTCD